MKIRYSKTGVRWAAVAALLFLPFLPPAASTSQDPAPPGWALSIGEPVTPGISLPAWSLPESPQSSARSRFRNINPRQPGRYVPDRTEADMQAPPLLPPLSAPRTPNPIRSFDGMDLQTAGVGIPPDPVGDIGPNHYVQMVNSSFAIYNKSGTLLLGPRGINSLWPPADTTPCRTLNSGDPIVLYDSLADRWVMSQFNFNSRAGDPVPPYYQCIAVSSTPNPTGSWYTYSFNTNSTELNDYPKLGVWPDGYYMGTNENGFSAYVFDRANMISGNTARALRKFSIANQNMMLPSDLDGSSAPPANSPNYFYTMKTGNKIELWAFHTDWNNPANTTFTNITTLTSSGFSYDVCPGNPQDKNSWDCIPQKGVTQFLDAIGEWPMFRFQYRNFGTYETLVGNFTVDVNPSANFDQAGIHWFELRKTGPTGNWTIRNEGNYAPDADHRWMGSAAMDRNGNIAVAYSVSGSGMYPAIRYTTRLAGDPAGQLGAEVTLYAGTASQSGLNRWGDYSALTVDPSDDCTFWFTSEYLRNTSEGWRTRIGVFKIPECGTNIYMPQVFKR